MRVYDIYTVAVVAHFYSDSYTGIPLVRVEKNAFPVHNDIIPKCKKT